MGYNSAADTIGLSSFV